MRIDKFIVILLVVALTACAKVDEVEMPVRECAMMPVGGRASASACVLNGKGYVFGGRDADGICYKDLWQYDPATDSWTSKGTMPGRARVNACMIAYQGCLYVGLGFAGGGAYNDDKYLRDWWRWNPATDKWDTLARYPDIATIAAVPYIVGDRIYAIYGASDCFTRALTWYDVAGDSWYREEDNHFRAQSGFKGAGAKVLDTYYYGLGYNSVNQNQWYRVDLLNDKWTKCTSLPGKGRTFSAYCASNRYIYVFGGRYFGGDMTGGEVFADIMRYDPEADSWARGGAMPCGRAENQIAFSIGDKVYFGMGEDKNGNIIQHLYCIDE